MSQLPTFHRKAFAFLVVGALLCAWIMALTPQVGLAQPFLPPTAGVEDAQPARAASTTTSRAVVPDRIAATLTVAGACVDTTPADLVCDSLTDTYKTIQKAIDMAAAGYTIDVLAGTYIENVIINKSVTLTGAGAATTTVYPAVSNPNPCTGSSLCGGATAASNIIVVAAENVVISGFTLDGDNTASTSGVVRGGADLDARNGIITDHSLGIPFGGLEVHHTTVKNIYLRGMYASTNGTFNFHDNTVTNVQGDSYSIAMFAWYGPGAMTNNTVSYANDAISANHSKGIQFLNNTVTHSGSGIHTDNSNDGGGTPDLIQDNTVSDCATDGYGIFVFVPYVAPTVTRNIVSNCAIGLSAWGTGAAVTTNFTYNVVTGVSGSVGAYVTTDMIGWGYSDVYVNFTGNVFSGHANGIWLTANQQSWNTYPYVAKTITAVFSDNSVTANTYPVGVDTQGVYNVNASGNWWGATDPAAVKAAVNGGVLVDYTPWLGSGADTSGTPGFQGDFSALWVDDDSPQTGTVGRVQEGVNLAVGSTVNVAPGTYPEQVTFARHGFTLQGSDPANRPVLTGAIAAAGSNNLTLRNLVVRGAYDGHVIKIGGNGFTMEKVTVDGENVAGRHGVGGGSVDGDISITYSEFLNIKGWVAFDTRGGSGNPSQGADINSGVFSHNTLRNTQGHINFRGTIGDSTPNVTISDNLVEQVGASTNSFGGIFKVFYATNVTFTNNTIKDVGTSGYNPAGEAAYGAGFIPRNVSNLTVTGNTFENNNQAIAVEPRNSNAYISPDGVLPNGTISNNTFTGNKYGIYVPATLHPTSNFAGLIVTGNRFTGSTTESVHNGYTGGTLNAENNWWGSACGPGATVSANVDYIPFWKTPTGVAATIPPAITDGMSASDQCLVINSAASGSTITYGAGTYPGGVIVTANNVTIDLGGAEVGPGSPAYTIVGNDVTLQNGVLNGVGPTSVAPAVLVQAGANNFTLSKVEVENWADGVQVAGAVQSLKIVNNFIHNNADAGLQVDGAVSGVATVEGNLFKANGPEAITSVAQPSQAAAKLPAQYNSFATKTCPTTYTNVDASNCTFAETYLDVDTVTTGDQFVLNVNETNTFDVKVMVDAQNLYGYTFKVSWDASKLAVGAITPTPPTNYACVLLSGLATNQVGYNCVSTVTPAAPWNGGSVLTINFTATGSGLSGDGPWDALIDVDHVASTAGTANGALVYLNNVKLAGVANDRDITDVAGDDGRIHITGIAQFRGFIDVQGRADDSGALLNVYPTAGLSGAVATATSAKGGAYTTAYSGSNLLTVGTTYHFVVDKALYVKTSASPAPSHELTTRAYTDLSTLVLKGGDANDDEKIDVGDAGLIGGAYGNFPTCSVGPCADVNGDGKVDILDLTLMGGNYGVTASAWVP